MSPEAEALREKLGEFSPFPLSDRARQEIAQRIARCIVEELKITEEMIDPVRKLCTPEHDTRRYAKALSTLLELAGAEE